jgi:hypothetical protein
VTTYKVGQIIYVVLRKEARVYPMQIVEEITKKTLEGEVTTYMVRGGTGADQTLPIADIDGEVFDSADKVKRVLTERATTGINQRVEQAVEKAKEWYVGGFEAVADDPLTLVKKQTCRRLRPKRNPGRPLLKSLSWQLSYRLIPLSSSYLTGQRRRSVTSSYPIPCSDGTPPKVRHTYLHEANCRSLTPAIR